MKNLMWIAWPSFLLACFLEALVFTLVDPMDIHWLSDGVNLSRQGICSLAFFVFWAVTGISSALSIFLMNLPSQTNHSSSGHQPVTE